MLRVGALGNVGGFQERLVAAICFSPDLRGGLF